ncbi:MAG: SPFH domain-containing protein [Bdellovibrionota bacterium]
MFGSSQLRSVIEWSNPSPEAVFERWTENGEEIKNASKLIVGPGQGCIFVYEGKVEAVYTAQGLYDLRTANIPFWTTITKFMQGFRSEHRVGLFFFKTSQLANQKWGTPAPVKYEDPTYKFPVGLRAFGNFSIEIQKPEWFFTKIVASHELYTATELRELLCSRIVQPMTQVFADSKLTYTEVDSHRNELAVKLTQSLNADFTTLGFILSDFRIEGTVFDDDTMKRINRIADVSAEAQAASAAGVNYAQMQQLQALRDAANNPGGAGTIMGMGVGMGLGQQAFGMAAGGEDAATRLQKLGMLLKQGLISQAEFDAKKKEILEKF